MISFDWISNLPNIWILTPKMAKIAHVKNGTFRGIFKHFNLVNWPLGASILDTEWNPMPIYLPTTNQLGTLSRGKVSLPLPKKEIKDDGQKGNY